MAEDNVDQLPEGTPIGVVQATGVIVVNGDPGNAANTELVKKIEGAMLAALQEAQADGVTDPDVLRARMLEARDKVLTE